MTLPTDRTITDLLVGLYGNTPMFDFVEPGAGDNSVCWAVKRIDGVDVVLLRGTYCFQDWIRDLAAFVIPFTHSKLGPIHPGFALGMSDAWHEIQKHTSGPYIVAGHSLGAARAAILTGLMLVDGKPPLSRIVFGDPKAGFLRFADYIKAVPARSYRNGNARHHDYVTDLPFSFPPEEYVHSSQPIIVTQPPTPAITERLGLFAWHDMTLYASAMAAQKAT